MISLKPREQFAIVWQKDNHNDEGTYYVRAFIRNSVTGSTIDTVNLTDNGNGRFVKVWEVPSDVSGEGFYIDITISVYSDSGYTTKATAYGDENAQYLVFDRKNPMQGGGGGGSDVDYKKIAKILKESLKPLIDRKEINLGPVLDEIRGVMGAVEAIEIPKPEELNILPALEAIGRAENNIVKAIAEKDVTPETELEDIKDALSKLLKKEPNLEITHAKISDLSKMLKNFIDYDSQRELGIQESKTTHLKEISRMLIPLLGQFAGEKNNETSSEEKSSRDPRISRLFPKTNEK